MKKAAKFIAGAAMVALLAFSPKAFSQQPLFADSAAAAATKSRAPGKGNIYRLCTYDTLRLRELAPAGSKPKFKAFSSKNARIKGMSITSTGAVPGFVSGRLSYKNGKTTRTLPITAKFSDCNAESVYLQKTGPTMERAHRRYAAPRSFFRLSPLEDNIASVGVTCYLDRYLIPNIGVITDLRAARLSDNWALRFDITFTIGLSKMKLAGEAQNDIDSRQSGNLTTREASARNIATSVCLPFEWGTGNFSVLFGPSIGVKMATGKYTESRYYCRLGVPSLLGSSEAGYSFWTQYLGLNLKLKVTIGNLDICAFFAGNTVLYGEGDKVGASPGFFPEAGVSVMYKINFIRGPGR